MNREIKFRGKSLDTNNWVYGYGMVVDIKFQIANIIHAQRVNRMQCSAVEFTTVGQYTGLKDKNGKEIYEGDLVKCTAAVSGRKSKDSKEMIGKVTQDTFGWTISLWYEGEWWAYGYMEYSNLEVIGNQFENPELLNK